MLGIDQNLLLYKSCEVSFLSICYARRDVAYYSRGTQCDWRWSDSRCWHFDEMINCKNRDFSIVIGKVDFHDSSHDICVQSQ